MSTTIEQLELEVQSNATSAVSGIDALASSLGKLKIATKGGVGLTAVSKQLTTLNTALGSISNANIGKLGNLNRALADLILSRKGQVVFLCCVSDYKSRYCCKRFRRNGLFCFEQTCEFSDSSCNRRIRQILTALFLNSQDCRVRYRLLTE